MRTIRLCFSLALADDAARWVAVVGKGGGWMSWESHHVAVVRRLRYSLALAGDADPWSTVACKGGVRMSIFPPRATARLESAQVKVPSMLWAPR
jgi:hypothetical protein